MKDTTSEQLKQPKRGIFELSITQHRERVFAAKPAHEPADVPFFDILVPAGENIKIPVTIYMPKEPREAELGTLFFIPGTGFIAQENKFTRVMASHICATSNCQVIVINHRLAPENQFPDGIIDCYNVFKFFVKHMPHRFLINQNAVAIGGYSSGGNFAISVAMKAKEEGLPLKRVILLSPMVDLSRALSRGFENIQNLDTDITEEFVNWCVELYTPKNVSLKSAAISPFWHKKERFNVLRNVGIDFLVGGDDRCFGDTEYFEQKLRHNGVHTTKEILPNEKHSYGWHNLKIADLIAKRLRAAFECSIESIPQYTVSLVPQLTSGATKEESNNNNHEQEEHGFEVPRSKL